MSADIVERLPEFNDPIVQTVYEILCADNEPPNGEHWEGFAARRIVAALAERAAVPAQVVEAAIPSAAVLLAEQVLHMDMVTERGLRARELARQVLNGSHDVHEGECAGVLRDLASWLGAGGYNAPAVDPKVFREKIVWGVQQLAGSAALTAQPAAAER